MVTIRNKTKAIKTYNLTCAISVAGGAVEKDDKGFERVQTERVLTLLAGEKRSGLPNEVVDSPEVKAAIDKGDLKVLSQDEPSFEAKKAQAFESNNSAKSSSKGKPAAPSKANEE